MDPYYTGTDFYSQVSDASETLSEMFKYTSSDDLNEFQVKLENAITMMIAGRPHTAFQQLAEAKTCFDNKLLIYKKQLLLNANSSVLLNDVDNESDAIKLYDEEDDEEDELPQLDSQEDSSDEEDDDSILEKTPKKFDRKNKFKRKKKVVEGKAQDEKEKTKTKNKNIPQYLKSKV